VTQAEDPHLREALEELDLYLADQLAPLLVADSIARLLSHSPTFTAEQLAGWAFDQAAVRPGELSLAEVFFHALKKVHQIHELGLVADARYPPFLQAVAGELLRRCPEEARDRFVALLSQLGAGAGRGRTPVSTLAHPATAAAPVMAAAAPAPLSPAALESLHRFSRLVAGRLGAGRETPGISASGETARQLLVLAAAGAGSSEELATRLERLKAAGVGPALERDLLRALIPSLPDWAVVLPPGAAPPPQGGTVDAVQRAVQLAGDRARTAERWKELVRSAAEEFNAGAFGRALTLAELAERMARDGEVDPRLAEITLAKAHEAYDVAMLLQAAAEDRHRPLLRRLLGIHPGWAPRELLDDLDLQADSKRRRLLLTLLEVWGGEARPIVVERLGLAIAGGARESNAWWYLRNLVFLLHRLPRGPGCDPRQELELVGPFSALGWHPSFQKEAFLLLAGLPGGLGLPLLVQRLGEAERAAAAPAPPQPREEMAKVFQALAGALVRSGSAEARRALIDHAFARRPGTGDSLARLRELGSIDLAVDPAALARLLEALHELTPRRLLGFTVGRREEELAHIVAALAATSAPGAREALADLAARFPETAFGHLAASGVRLPSAAEEEEREDEGGGVVPTPAPQPPRASLSGDLDLFGLPGLLQSLQQTEATGRLVIRDEQGRIAAELHLAGGRLADCRSGRLAGDAAFYQLLELPFPGSFEFTRGASGPAPPAGGSRDLFGLLLESMRRHDELRRARALVPDAALLRAGSARPTGPEGEQDGELLRAVWMRVRDGARAADCDDAAPVDLYRIRTLLAHWVAEGALELEPGTAPP